MKTALQSVKGVSESDCEVSVRLKVLRQKETCESPMI